jgi:chaperone required for assembly of F1-ATPase
MNDDLFNDLIPSAREATDPASLARRDLQKSLPRRFWTAVSVRETEGGFEVTLDGRTVRTPAKAPMLLPSIRSAELVAAEWTAIGEVVDPHAMPVTRIVNSALDGVAKEANAVADDLLRYAGTDLLCYRVSDPERLVARQARNWDPLLDWMQERFGARFTLAEGVMFHAQPERTISAVRDEVGRIAGTIPLAALHVMTTLTGSVVLALAVAHERLSAAEAWAAAHLDEDFQMEVWGEDEEALRRRTVRRRDFEAAAALHAATTRPLRAG